MMRSIRTAQKNHPGFKLVFAGHSLGGALASLAAADYVSHESGDTSYVSLYTASPTTLYVGISSHQPRVLITSDKVTETCTNWASLVKPLTVQLKLCLALGSMHMYMVTIGLLYSTAYSTATQQSTQQDFKVLECPPELVAYLQSYKTLIIRGEDNDEAVICTDNSTYCLRQSAIECIQSCFPDTRIDAVSDIIFTHSNYLEVVRIPPKLDRLAMLLAKCPYGGPEEEQRSEAEIRLYLDETGAIEIDGHWRLLSPAYSLYIVQLIMLTVMERDMDTSKLSLTNLFIILCEDNISESVLRRCLISNSDSSEIVGQGTLSFGWRSDQDYSIFPKSLLSTDSRVRFEDLFKIRKRWLREDMLPFVEDLASTDKARELIILKNARTKVGALTILLHGLQHFRDKNFNTIIFLVTNPLLIVGHAQ
ncbi:hypothetical protein BASA83_013635 [Batrachochytrium salamandrivorans]|nr:hypothetical protein BASA83_013635 [Batrachochytrium salamandrivorans]